MGVIKAGVELLDEKMPDWREKIDVTSLNLGTCHLCILGQLFGDYDHGVLKIVPDDVSTESLGFEIPRYGGESSYGYEELTQEWIDEIKSKEGDE